MFRIVLEYIIAIKYIPEPYYLITENESAVSFAVIVLMLK